jgi:hypothetical protein
MVSPSSSGPTRIEIHLKMSPFGTCDAQQWIAGRSVLIDQAARPGLGPRALLLGAVAIAGLVAIIMLIRRRR